MSCEWRHIHCIPQQSSSVEEYQIYANRWLSELLNTSHDSSLTVQLLIYFCQENGIVQFVWHSGINGVRLLEKLFFF